MIKKLVAFLKNKTVMHVGGAFLASLAAQPAVAAVLHGSFSITRDALTSALVGAAVMTLHKFLPKTGA